MDDLGSVCCMCGDIGFSEKLFRCINCHHRIQHTYCSNYYGEFTQEIEQCDWCQSEEIKNSSSSRATVSSKKSSTSSVRTNRSENNNTKHNCDDVSSSEKAKIPSPRTSNRRYKLLKDVMC